MKKLSRSFTPGLAQSFLICLTLLCWAEKNHPIIIFALMFIVCVAIIRTKIPNKRARLPKKFKETQCISLFSSTIFMFTCFILFKTEYKEHLYAIILTIATIISMVLIARSHIASIDNKEKTLSSCTKTIIKYTCCVHTSLPVLVPDIPQPVVAGRDEPYRSECDTGNLPSGGRGAGDIHGNPHMGTRPAVASAHTPVDNSRRCDVSSHLEKPSFLRP